MSGANARLISFIDRATALSKLLRLRLAYPITGPGLPPTQAKESLAPIKPAIVGLARASDLLRIGHALSYYRGERSAESTPAEKFPGSINKVNDLRPKINRKHRAKTTVGLHAGWDRYASDRGVSPQDTWKN